MQGILSTATKLLFIAEISIRAQLFLEKIITETAFFGILQNTCQDPKIGDTNTYIAKNLTNVQKCDRIYIGIAHHSMS